MWQQRTSGPVELPQKPGATRTFYELVLIGANLDLASPSAVFDTPRFVLFWDEWRDRLPGLWMKTFVFDFLVPISENLAVGPRVSVPGTNEATAIAGLWAAMATLDLGKLIRDLQHTVTFPLHEDWPSCPADDANCYCPRLGANTGFPSQSQYAWYGLVATDRLLRMGLPRMNLLCPAARPSTAPASTNRSLVIHRHQIPPLTRKRS